ncbi:hypothetical protein BJX70DRAFT_312970 [Aspergillus crustosus]
MDSNQQATSSDHLRSKKTLQPHPNTHVKAEQKDKGTIHSRKVIQGQLKSLGLPQVLSSRKEASPLPIFRDKECPWDTYKPVFSCKLAGTVIFAVNKTRPSKLKAFRVYSPPHADRVLRLFQIIQHENIISARECYREREQLFVLVDDLPLTLEHIVSLRPDQHQLASIMFQILNGLNYLTVAGFEHTRLTPSNILLGSDGTLKIAAFEHCVKRRPEQPQAPLINALVNLMMQLMQSYEMEDGVIGVDDTKRWPLDSDAFSFLEATSSAHSVETLMKHPFVAGKHRPGELVSVTRLAPIATKTFYSYQV